jgi:hypothetical protein
MGGGTIRSLPVLPRSLDRKVHLLGSGRRRFRDSIENSNGITTQGTCLVRWCRDSTDVSSPLQGRPCFPPSFFLQRRQFLERQTAEFTRNVTNVCFKLGG